MSLADTLARWAAKPLPAPETREDGPRCPRDQMPCRGPLGPCLGCPHRRLYADKRRE